MNNILCYIILYNYIIFFIILIIKNKNLFKNYNYNNKLILFNL